MTASPDRLFNIDQRILLRGVLEFHGYHALSGLNDRDLLFHYGRCRGGPVEYLFNPANRPHRARGSYFYARPKPKGTSI